MTHELTIQLGDRHDLTWAQSTVTQAHYLHQPVDPRARPMVYVVMHGIARAGLVMLGIPHATRCGGWWGYPGLPTQWQTVDLNRIYIHPYFQPGESGIYTREPGVVPGFVDRKGVFRPTVATWAIREVLQRVQADRVRLWPPVYPSQPYHIRLAISYSDPQFHKGTIYKAAGALPMYMANGQPVPGPAGKYGWCWKLDEPGWTWDGLTEIRPRTLRMEFA